MPGYYRSVPVGRTLAFQHWPASRITAPSLTAEVGAPSTGAAVIEEVHRALVLLGFSPKDAADALAKTAKPGVGPEDLLRAALGVLR